MSVDFTVPEALPAAGWAAPSPEPAAAPHDRPAAAPATSLPATSPPAAPAPAARLAVTQQGANIAGRAATPAWSLARRVGFRFAFSYLILYSFPFPLDYLPIPGLQAVFQAYSGFWGAVVAWIGRHVLHLSRELPPLRVQTGSGDTTYDYVQILCFAAFSALAALVWTVAARRVRDHRRLDEWLRIYVRYVLGATLLSYGMAKVIKTQFPSPSADRLLEPFGDASPMGLLWTFMGYSTPYTVFAGAMELLGGVLLFFRRTTTLGALVVIAVMTNVVMLNLCYDVPVKQYSMHLLAMGAFLLLPDLPRLANVLVLNRPAAPARLASPLSARWARISGLALGILFLGYLLYLSTMQNLQLVKQMSPGGPHPTLYGTFEVEEVVRNGQTVPPLLTDASRWRRLTSLYPGFLTVRSMDGSVHRYRTESPPAAHRISLLAFANKAKQGSFTFAALDQDHVLLRGNLLADALVVKLRRIEAGKHQLLTRGFHWITEIPFNR